MQYSFTFAEQHNFVYSSVRRLLEKLLAPKKEIIKYSRNVRIEAEKKKLKEF